jgi:hypothetical protein
LSRLSLGQVGAIILSKINWSRALYTDIIEPIGYRAKEHNESYARERAHVTNLLTKQFIDRFCNERGAIDWEQLVEFNCGNYDLDKFLP